MVAAVVGAGFASGREIVVFFSGWGAASWLGIVAASAGVGFLTSILSGFAMRTREDSFPGIYRSVMGERCGEAVQVLHGLLMMMTGGVMLAAGGELGSLALPVRYAYPLGMALTLLMGALLSRLGIRALAAVGGTLVPAVVIYYLLMALDGRPAVPFASAQHTAVTLGSFPLCFILGMLYASLNIAMAGGVVCLTGQQCVSPRNLGLLTAGCMLLMLLPANAAFLRAGSWVREMALPSVVLAARWGVAGYYASITVLYLAVVTTMCAALSSMSAQGRLLGLKRGAALALSCAGSLLLAVCGFEQLVNVGYPLMGWSCAFVLLALLAFVDWPERKRRGTSKDA